LRIWNALTDAFQKKNAKLERDEIEKQKWWTPENRLNAQSKREKAMTGGLSFSITNQGSGRTQSQQG